MRDKETTHFDHTRFFVVHVRKAAGTSLRRRFLAAFDKSEIYPNKTDGPLSSLIDMPSLAAHWPERRDDVRVVIGHFPLCAVELLDDPFVTLTVLRDPIERTLSFLRFQKRIIPADHDKTLLQIYETQPRFETHIRNHMTRMYSLTLDEAITGDGALTVVESTLDRLEQAKHSLATVDVVGFHNAFDDFCREVSSRYDLDLGEPVHVNVSPPGEVSEEFRARIAEDNALDVALYAHALELYGP